MDEENLRIFNRVSCIKNVMLRNKNMDILLYLAKYNPDVSVEDIVKHFGKNSIDGLKDLERCNLVKQDNGNVTLTNEALFQIDGLLLAVGR